MENLIYEEHGKYFLQSGTEITKQDFDAINAATARPDSGTLSEADILRLHQEQDPASPFYKRPESAGAGVSESTPKGAESAKRYYEPTPGEIEAAAAKIPDPTGTTTITTEQATIPPVIEETPKAEEEVVTELEAEKAKLVSTAKDDDEQLKQTPAAEDKVEAAKEAEQVKTPPPVTKVTKPKGNNKK